jgi:hypothetical protein
MTEKGWKEVKDIDVLQDKIGIYADNLLPCEQTPDIPKKGVFVFILVSSIEKHNNVRIADITVESENHSFIASSFVFDPLEGIHLAISNKGNVLFSKNMQRK